MNSRLLFHSIEMQTATRHMEMNLFELNMLDMFVTSL